MSEIVFLLKMIVTILVDAIADYDQTPHGHAAIEALLKRVEADGFDIPFWEPEGELQPFPLNMTGEAVSSAVDAMAARWRERHPETQSGGGD